MIIGYKVLGDEKVLKNNKEMRARAVDPRPATKRAKELFIKANKGTFKSAGASIGATWARNAPSTLERKKREGIDAHPLHGKTGALERSLLGGKGKKTSATKGGAKAGTKVWYATFTRGTRGGEPKRDLFSLTAAQRQQVLKMVSTYVTTGRVL